MAVTFVVGIGVVTGLIVIVALLFLLLSSRDDNRDRRE